MTIRIRNFLLITAAALSIVVRAQEAEPIRWALEKFQTRCIPLWSDHPTVEEEDCTVAEFGEIAELGGSTFYFARYHDRSRPVPGELPPYWVIEFNALVILRSDPPDLEEATVIHVRTDEAYGFMTHLAPELLQTDRGPILYLAGRGLGAGRSQYDKDEYWLWQSDTWVPLDVHGWIYDFRDRMPDGFRLTGIGDLATALSTMTYVDPAVHRDGDAMCCASGGTIWIHFEWDDLTLRAVSFEHDPSVQLTD